MKNSLISMLMKVIFYIILSTVYYIHREW